MLGLRPVVYCSKWPTQPIAIGRWRRRCLTDTCGFRRKGTNVTGSTIPVEGGLLVGRRANS